jgi:deoxycytidine triphosphate deaminase
VPALADYVVIETGLRSFCHLLARPSTVKNQMPVLSDATILSGMAAGNYLIGGDPAQVRHCAYRFTAAKIFTPGTSGAVVNWESPPADASYSLAPGAIVWVRASARVKMPPDVCAFYHQTNGLSRKGVMLVNSSMVEPGYEGPLACLFVNFGKEPVLLHPTTTVAKLIFFRLDHSAGQLFPESVGSASYDGELRDTAARAPGSFLQVGDLATSLDKQKDDAVSEIKTAAEAARKDELGLLKSDVKGAMQRTFGIALLALGVVITVLNVSAWIQEKVRPSWEKDIQDRVEAEVRHQSTVSASSLSARRDSVEAAVSLRLDSLKRSNAQLRTKLDSILKAK